METLDKSEARRSRVLCHRAALAIMLCCALAAISTIYIAAIASVSASATPLQSLSLSRSAGFYNVTSHPITHKGSAGEIYMMFNIKSSQFGNQLHALANALMLAKSMNWTLVLPAFLPNGADAFRTAGSKSHELLVQDFLDEDQLKPQVNTISLEKFHTEVFPQLKLDQIAAVCQHWKGPPEKCSDEYVNSNMRAFYERHLQIQLPSHVNRDALAKVSLRMLHAQGREIKQGVLLERRLLQRHTRGMTEPVRVFAFNTMFSPVQMSTGSCVANGNAILDALMPAEALRALGRAFVHEVMANEKPEAAVAAMHVRIFEHEISAGVAQDADTFVSHMQNVIAFASTNSALDALYLARAGRHDFENEAMAIVTDSLRKKGTRVYELKDMLKWLDSDGARLATDAKVAAILQSPFRSLLLDTSVMLAAPQAIFKSSSSWTPLLRQWRSSLIFNQTRDEISTSHSLSQPLIFSDVEYNFNLRSGLQPELDVKTVPQYYTALPSRCFASQLQ